MTPEEEVAQSFAEQDCDWDIDNGYWIVTKRVGNKFEALTKDENTGELSAFRITVNQIPTDEIKEEIQTFYLRNTYSEEMTEDLNKL